MSNRLQPTEAEMALLGCLLLENGNALPNILPKIDRSYFCVKEHREICISLTNVFNKLGKITPTLVWENLNQRGKASQIACDYLVKLMEVGIGDATDYLKILEEAAIKRRISQLSQTANLKAQNGECAKEVLDYLKTGILTIEQNFEAEPLVEKFKVEDDIELPLGSMHPIFSRYWQQYERKTEAPKEFVVSSFLASLAATLGNATYLKTVSGIRPNLYLVLAGDSTFMRKTTSMDLGTAALMVMSERKKQEYLARKTEWDERFAEAKNGKEKCELLKQKPKDLSNIYSNELTPEMLLEKMADKSDGLFLYSEFGGLLARLDTNYMKGFKEKLTEFFDGRNVAYRRETKNSGCITIDSPAPSLLACSTFQWMQAHLSDFDLLSGFLGRFLFVCRESYPALDVALPPYFEPDSAWVKFFNNLDGFCGPLHLTKMAASSYNKWYKEYKSWALDQDVILHSFLGRMMTVCHKIAIINHATECALLENDFDKKALDEIDSTSYEQAYPWIEFFSKNLLVSYQKITQGADIREIKVREAIKKRGKKVGEYVMLSASKIATFTNMRKKEFTQVIESMELKKQVLCIKNGKHTYWAISV